MKKKLVDIISIIFSILLIIYFETYAYKLINIIGINISNYSSTIQNIINISLKLIMCFFIYLIYKKDYRSRRGNNNLLKVLLIFVISLVSITLGMYIFNYVVKFIGDIFNIEVLETSFYNIFNKTLDLNLIIKIISDYVIEPFLYCSTIILSVEKIIRNKNTSILLSGVVASVIYSVSLSGTVGFIIINSLSTFLLFSMLMFIYKKGYSIYFIICLYSFYLMSNVVILSFLGV